jgi:hypothetical protein
MVYFANIIGSILLAQFSWLNQGQRVSHSIIVW